MGPVSIRHRRVHSYCSTRGDPRRAESPANGHLLSTLNCPALLIGNACVEFAASVGLHCFASRSTPVMPSACAVGAGP